MNIKPRCAPFTIKRRTRETVFEVDFRPRSAASKMVRVPNCLLGHLLDHTLKACGVAIEMTDLSWPGSWRLDHVLCEDLGQIIGSGMAEIHDQMQGACGVAGRAGATVCMDDSLVACTISFEDRPRCEWIVPPAKSIDGFVDAWYDEAGHMIGQARGTNLRQFFDGFAVGARSTVVVEVRRAGNLHHVFEAAFRGLGDAAGAALGLVSATDRVAGDSSGFAGSAEYVVHRVG